MSVTAHLEIAEEELGAFCRKWHVTELALFGSVLRDDFRPDSDVDVLVTFAPGARLSFFDFLRAKEELQELLGHSVDLVERKAVEQSPNYIRRRQILESARVVYGT